MSNLFSEKKIFENETEKKKESIHSKKKAWWSYNIAKIDLMTVLPTKVNWELKMKIWKI